MKSRNSPTVPVTPISLAAARRMLSTEGENERARRNPFSIIALPRDPLKYLKCPFLSLFIFLPPLHFFFVSVCPTILSFLSFFLLLSSFDVPSLEVSSDCRLTIRQSDIARYLCTVGVIWRFFEFLFLLSGTLVKAVY